MKIRPWGPLNKARWRFGRPQFVTPALCSVDPMATIMTVKNLEISTYSFTVVAQTPLGRCGKSSGSITLSTSLLAPSNTYSAQKTLTYSIWHLWNSIFFHSAGEDIPNNFWLLVIPVMFFTLMVILCYRYWTWSVAVHFLQLPFLAAPGCRQILSSRFFHSFFFPSRPKASTRRCVLSSQRQCWRTSGRQKR